MQVTITADEYKDCRGYSDVELELPTDRFSLADALERARVPDGGYELHSFYDWPEFIKYALTRAENKTLEEVNFLAHKVSEMDTDQLHIYEGILKLRFDSDIDHPMSMKELINTAYNLKCFELYPGVTDYQELGEICIQNEIMDWIKKLPDEIVEMLDPEKVGTSVCRDDQGIFIREGYLFRSAPDGPEIYDGIHLPDQEYHHGGIISLRLERKDIFLDANTEVWLELPADRQKIHQVLDFLGTSDLDVCMIVEMESIVPAMKDHLTGYEDIEKLNTLTERIAAFPDSRTLAKYKAILMMEDCYDLDMVLDIINNLDCYDFDTQIMSPGHYAEYILKEAGFDPDDPAFCGFDFYDYGERQLRGSGYVATAYGTVIRNDLPFILEYTKPPEQGMTMQ